MKPTPWLMEIVVELALTNTVVPWREEPVRPLQPQPRPEVGVRELQLHLQQEAGEHRHRRLLAFPEEALPPNVLMSGLSTPIGMS